MKIALICTEKLPVPPVAGGAVQLYINGILPYLSKKHKITVFGIEYPGLPAVETVNDVQFVRLPAKTTNEYLENLKKTLTDDFNLVHVFNRPLWVLALSKNLPHVRFSLSLHNEMFHPEKISDKDGIACIKRVEFINTVSRFIADGVESRFPFAASKLRVVYSGVDTQLYKPAWSEEARQNKAQLKEKYNIRGCKVIVFIGRLSTKKGVHILMKALKKVMSSNPRVALVIVGSKWYGENKSDEYTRSLERLAKDLPGPIIFTGFLPPSEIPAHFNMADIFVCPSQWDEPLARVHYEAMAAGLPIITTNRGGNAEVVQGHKNGKIINNYSSPDVFASCIDYILNNPEEAASMGRNGRKHAEEKYNWERVAREMLASVEKDS